MYYTDLSTYEYASRKKVEGILSVGWLDHLHDYPTGSVADEVISKLRQLLFEKRDIHKMRGTHQCTLCWTDQVYVEITTIRRLLGMSEIWIPSQKGVIYAAPSMIYHYIVEHHYKPPQDFLDAVLEYDPSSNWNGEQVLDRLLEQQSWKNKLLRLVIGRAKLR